ncbi:MAG: HAMP domain-containing sensor histidine kinase [Bacteroidota bacterium]
MCRFSLWIGCLSLLGLLLGETACSFQPTFSELKPQIETILDCDCNVSLEQPLANEKELRSIHIDGVVRALLQKKLAPEQALLCADKLQTLLESLPENREILKTIQQAIILKYYVYTVLKDEENLVVISKEELAVAQKLGEYENLVTAYFHRIGTLHYDDSEHLKEAYILEAEVLAKKSLDKYLMLIVNELYRSYAQEQGDNAKVIALALEAKELVTEEENKRFAFNAELLLGTNFLDQDLYALADSSLQIAYQLAIELDFLRPIRKSLQALVMLYARTEDLPQAKRYHDELAALMADFPNSRTHDTDLAIAYYLYASRQYEEASASLEALTVSLQERYNAAELKFLIAEKTNEQPLEAYARFRDLKDSLNIIGYERTAELKLSQEREKRSQLALQKEQQINGLQNKALIVLAVVLGVIGIQFLLLWQSWQKIQRNNQQLEEGNQRLRDFSKIISHDLRDPLRTVHSYTQLIERKLTPPNPQIESMVQTVLTASRQMDQLLEDVRTYSEGFAGELKQEEVDLLALLGTLKENISNRLDSSQARLEASELPTLFVNRSILYQIFQNLILNAIHYTPAARTPIIRISVEHTKESLQILIADNGVGIPAEELDKIFEPYYRGSIKQPGTGLGLAIVKNCVAMLDGKIWVESELDYGSRFFIQLPASVLAPATSYS